MELPIDVVPGSKPQRFRWKQTTDAYGGPREVQYEGTLPVSVEGPVAKLIDLVKQQASDIENLRRINLSLADRCDGQSDTLTQMAEQPSSSRKRKGKQ